VPDTVRETFDHLRLTLRTEIPRQLEHPEGGHYVVALLVAIGSEALSRLQGYGKKRVFLEMTTKHGLSPAMASDVFDALRQGIAHTYDTKFIKAGVPKIELIVSWGGEEASFGPAGPAGLIPQRTDDVGGPRCGDDNARDYAATRRPAAGQVGREEYPPRRSAGGGLARMD